MYDQLLHGAYQLQLPWIPLLPTWWLPRSCWGNEVAFLREEWHIYDSGEFIKVPPRESSVVYSWNWTHHHFICSDRFRRWKFRDKLIWSRSVEKRKLCYTTFIGDGDSKSFNQVCDLNLYSNTTVRKEVCLAHVTKRLKKTLCIVRKNTKNHSCIQHKLAEPKATYISSNYSTAILQHKRQSPATIANRLNIFLSHASGTHEHSPITHSANRDELIALYASFLSRSFSGRSLTDLCQRVSSIHILLSEVITVFHFSIFPLAERPKGKKNWMEL